MPSDYDDKTMAETAWRLYAAVGKLWKHSATQEAEKYLADNKNGGECEHTATT